MNRRRMLTWLGLGGLAAMAGGIGIAKAQSGNRYYSGPVSDHFDGRTFFNPGGEEPRGFSDLLRWQFGETKARWPDEFPSPFAGAVPDASVDGDAMRVSMIGHATMLIQVSGLNILTDPVFSTRASPFQFAGPARVNAPGIAFEALPKIDLVLLTHNHYDHLDLLTLSRLKQDHDPLVVTPLGNDVIVKTDIPDMRLHVQDWGDAFEFGPLTIHCEPAHHWSARGMRDRRMALWASFVIETPAGRIYHIGDTGFHSGINYRAVAEKHDGFRLAILPVGAYDPRWFMAAQHQDPNEAVEGMRLANADFAIGHHWGTFQLTNEAIEEPRDLLLVALDTAGIARERFRPLQPGEAWDIPSGIA
ncbi:MAG: MBL fold metallo-hydrolase [Rhizobiaceae bacterium]|nr:MBL fold metallo-hydrolase [Rhizobiaceae bacterium]